MIDEVPGEALIAKAFTVDVELGVEKGGLKGLGPVAFVLVSQQQKVRHPAVAAGEKTGSLENPRALTISHASPTAAPLWSPRVCWNGVVNGAYETISARVLAPLVGTPFFNAYLRQLGCSVGRHACIWTTRFTGFDLVEIGSRAALNEGVVIRSQLVEDRTMKSSRVRIGDDCSVGNMSVLLYDTEMGRGSALGPLSLLMKGASIPEAGRRVGIPAGREALQDAQGRQQAVDADGDARAGYPVATEALHEGVVAATGGNGAEARQIVEMSLEHRTRVVREPPCHREVDADV